MSEGGLIRDGRGRLTCAWHAGLPDYVAYHDHEWGRPVADDVRLLEKLCLEGFQSGLSWLTILRKRENFRRAFAGFEAEKMARFGRADVERLVRDAGIIRHRGKIESAINNARRALAVAEAFGSLAALLWRFAPESVGRAPRRADIVAQTPASIALSKELKARGFTFVGPTTCHAFMQAVGMVNDHLDGCWVREQVEAERAAFIRPG